MAEPTDFTKYEFKTFDGLPPDGEGGQFFGFDKDSRAFILRWVKPFAGEPGFWGAVGFEPAHGHSPRRDFYQVAFACTEGHRIVSWAAAPWAFDEAA